MLGQTDMQIDPSGILYMCDVKYTAFGHVDDGPVREAWRSEQARAVRRGIRECQRPCASMRNRSPGLLGEGGNLSAVRACGQTVKDGPRAAIPPLPQAQLGSARMA